MRNSLVPPLGWPGQTKLLCQRPAVVPRWLGLWMAVVGCFLKIHLLAVERGDLAKLRPNEVVAKAIAEGKLGSG